MTRIHLVSGAAAAFMLAGSLSSTPASAGDRLSPGGAAALGAVGGLALGLGIAAAAQPPVYAPPPPQPVYVPPAPVYTARPVRVVRERVIEEEEQCYVERVRQWVPGWGWEVRRRTVCN